MVEWVWATAHGTVWFPGWVLFQLAAVALGGALVARERDGGLVVPYVAGVLLAAVGAVVLGCGADWVTWVTHGRSGPAPELEIAGFGAIAGLVGGYVLVSRARGAGTGAALDVLAPSIGAMIAVARTGCFFAGCDFGAPSRLPWALRYPLMTPAFRAQVDAGLVSANAAQTLPVHPTQLYEACAGIAVLAATLAWRSSRREGDRFAVALLLYAACRFVIDFFRGDLARGGSFGLTTTQGMALALAGVLVAWRASSHASAEVSEAP